MLSIWLIIIIGSGTHKKTQDAKYKIQGIRKVHTMDLFVCNMANWVEHGRKSRNTFFVKKNKNYFKETVNKMIHDGGCLMIIQAETSQEIPHHYTNLHISSNDSNLQPIELERKYQHS